jgi:hypothetical protein
MLSARRARRINLWNERYKRVENGIGTSSNLDDSRRSN